MRLVTYEYNGQAGVGVRSSEGVIALDYPSMLDLIAAGERGLADIRRAAASGAPSFTPSRLLAPIGAPGKLLFSGINYRSHQQENPSAVLPTSPLFFAKLPSSIIGPEQPIEIPETNSQVDYEVELAIVIGKTARRVAQTEALSYVFGYTVANDISGRDIQFADNQITTGKGYDTFCPLGPEIVLPDEIPDPSQLHVSSYVNGKLRQSSPTSDMIFTVEQLIEFLSKHITLYPGDIVTTGTPAGVGCFRNPPAYLKPGDTIVVEVDTIGKLSNPVVAGW